MAILKLTSEIVDQDTKVWLSWDGFESTSSDDIVNFIDSIPADDNNIVIRINCPGGNVWEGWRMYDALRSSGKEISVIVEGMCASMATVVMMAAPKEKRTSYPHAVFLIHNPEVGGFNIDYPNRLTADNIEGMTEQMNAQAQALRDEQKKILDLYVERTGTDAATLQELMDKDIVITTDKAIELGLISSTLAPNTASFKSNFNNKQTMNKENKVEVGKSWLARLCSLAGFKSVEDVKFTDLSFTAADGRTFAVEREEGLYAVGDKAAPDGSYVMEDGSTVNIVNGAISEIIEAAFEIKNPENGSVISAEEAQHLLNEYAQKITDLNAKIEALTTGATESKENIDKLTNEIVDLNKTITELTAKVNDYEANAISDEQRGMLNVIAEAGGKEWFDVMIAKKSDGAPNVPQSSNEPVKIGEDFMADMAKNNKRFR